MVENRAVQGGSYAICAEAHRLLGLTFLTVCLSSSAFGRTWRRLFVQTWFILHHSAAHNDGTTAQPLGLQRPPTVHGGSPTNETTRALYELQTECPDLIVQLAGHPTCMVFYGGAGFVVRTAVASGFADSSLACGRRHHLGMEFAVPPPLLPLILCGCSQTSSAAHEQSQRFGVAQTTACDFLYAAYAQTGHVDVFDSGFSSGELFPGRSSTRVFRKGFAPFGIQNTSEAKIWSLRKQDYTRKDEVAGR